MRRALAILLVFAFSLPLIAPALASAADESQIPACCRRNGRHHCAMFSDAVSVNASKRVTTISGKCPCPPLGRVALMLPHALSSHHAPAAIAQIAGPAAVLREVAAGYRVSFDRSRQKRGPPQLASL